MKRRVFLRNTGLATGGVLMMQQQLLASIFQQPGFKITMLTDNIGIFTERGGTILFYLDKDGITVVDSQFPDTAPHLIEELKKKSQQPFRLLINTHHHGDHSGGNIAFKGITEHVLAHVNSKANMERVAQQQNSADKQLFPDQTYNHSWCQKMGKEQICLYYFGAAHTDGDSVVHFTRSNIAHMGDLVFNRRHPFVDRTAGANMKSWIGVLDKTQKKCDNKTKYVFGHAEQGFEVTGTADDLKLFAEYLDNVLKFAESEIKSGKSKEDILKTAQAPFSTEWKGSGFQRTLQAAYEELTSV